MSSDAGHPHLADTNLGELAAISASNRSCDTLGAATLPHVSSIGWDVAVSLGSQPLISTAPFSSAWWNGQVLDAQRRVCLVHAEGPDAAPRTPAAHHGGQASWNKVFPGQNIGPYSCLSGLLHLGAVRDEGVENEEVNSQQRERPDGKAGNPREVDQRADRYEEDGKATRPQRTCEALPRTRGLQRSTAPSPTGCNSPGW